MRREITARKTTRRGPDDEVDAEFWARVTPDERFAEAWRLKGWDPGELGLSRSVTRLIRRGR